MPYTPPYPGGWEDTPSTDTLISADALNTMDTGIGDATDTAEAAAASIAAHLADTVDAHDASAISVTPAGTIASDTVQEALEELAGDITAGGIPATLFDNKGGLLGATADNAVGLVTAATADDLVLTSDSAQATGMKWGPLPDLAAHLADTTDAHDASAISVADAGGYFTSTEVEGALQEVAADAAGAASLALIIALG